MKKDFIKDSVFSVLTHILVYMKALILIPIIIKTVGVAMYGSFTLITSLVGIILGLSSLGVGVKSNRYLPSAKSKEERAKFFYPQFYFKLCIIFLISIIIVLFQETITNYLTADNFVFSIYIIPAFLFLYTFYVHTHSYLRYTSRIFYMNIISIAYAYGHVLFILFYSNIIGDININILFLSQGIVAFLISIPFIVLIYKELGFNFIFFKSHELKEQIKIGFPLVLNLIVDFVLAASDRFILAYFMGVHAVGLYVPAYVLGSTILLVPKAIGTVVPQMMSKSVDKGDFAQAKILFYNSVKMYIVISIPFVFGIYLIGHEALILLANEEVAKEGKNIATLVAISSIFYGLNIMLSQANMVDLKTGVIFKANLIAAIVNVILNIILLSFIQSIYIPAITTIISFMIATIYFYNSLDNKWFDSRIFTLFIKVFLVSFVMFILVHSMEQYIGDISLLSLLFLKIILSTILYGILLLIFKIYTPEQFRDLKRVFRK